LDREGPYETADAQLVLSGIEVSIQERKGRLSGNDDFRRVHPGERGCSDKGRESANHQKGGTAFPFLLGMTNYHQHFIKGYLD
jgi:hypothetical protein